MKTLITKFWKHLLCVLFFFVGAWVFNHFSAWLGIAISAIAVVSFLDFISKSIKGYLDEFED